MTHYSPDHKKIVPAMLAQAYEVRVNDLPKSIALAQEALELSERMGDQHSYARSLSHLSLFHMIMGHYESALGLGERAAETFKALGDRKGIADARYNIASVYYKTDNYHLGLVQLQECLSIYREFNDHHQQSKVHKSIGTIYEYFGDFVNAVHAYELGIETAKLAEDLNLESNCYNPLSGIYLKQGDTERALEIIQKAIVQKMHTHDMRGLAFSIYGRGKVFTEMGDYFMAETDLKKSLEMHLHHGERLGAGMAYHKLGALYARKGELEKAKETWLEGHRFSEKFNIVLTRSKCSHQLATIYKNENNFEKAFQFLSQYQQEKEAIINSQVRRVIDNYDVISRMKSLEREAEIQKERAEIIEKKNRAEEAARIKAEFLSTMSHEIRTPLNAVITISKLLQERSTEEDQKLLDSLRFSGHNLLRIVNDILDFSKMESGKMQLQIQPLDMGLFMENIFQTYHGLAHSKGIKLELLVDPRAMKHYETDETRLAQIVGNLLSNAIKFTDEGGVQLLLKWADSNAESDRLLCEVVDTGEGIAPHHLEYIFESFAQPQSVTTKKKGGTGLGLAIVKRIADLFGTAILVESEVEKGSRFYFEIELKRSSPEQKRNEDQGISLVGKRVLLAEDNAINALVAKQLLHDWGMVVVHAIDGAATAQLASEQTFDLILMDIHMPGMNGYDAARAIMTDSLNKTTPMYALTADITADHDGSSEGLFRGFLSKPIQIDVMKNTLMQLWVRG